MEPPANVPTDQLRPMPEYRCPACKRGGIRPYAKNFATFGGVRYRDSLCRCGKCGRLWKIREALPQATR